MEQDAITAKLADLPDWERDEDSGGIVKRMEFPQFADAVAFVNRVATVADAHDHHPDIDIRYRRLKIVLVSHDVGGLSDRDFRMAKLIDGLAAEAADG